MRYIALLPLILLAACSSEDRSAGGVTASEARALERAAEMLEDQRLPAGTVPSGPQVQAQSPTPSPSPSAQPPG